MLVELFHEIVDDFLDLFGRTIVMSALWIPDGFNVMRMAVRHFVMM